MNKEALGTAYSLPGRVDEYVLAAVGLYEAKTFLDVDGQSASTLEMVVVDPIDLTAAQDLDRVPPAAGAW